LIRAEAAISRFRRDVTLARLVRGLFFAALLAAFLLPFTPVALDPLLVLPVIACVFLVLTMGSVKGSRLITDSPTLIAAGRFDEAERRIEQALRGFSLFRHVKVLGLHHLALLRHAQKNWHESAMLCRALLAQRGAATSGVARPARLMLADALLELGDTRGGGAAIDELVRQRLSLSEVLKLLAVQLDYQSRLGAWGDMTSGLTAKVQLAELMPSATAARTQALLALAARHTGRQDWSDWLRRRAELLADVQKLATERPVLWDLWRQEAAGMTKHQ
jgi:hypothetical protein